jgi:uncharacterized membrane protein YidH (DUF202 family)
VCGSVDFGLDGKRSESSLNVKNQIYRLRCTVVFIVAVIGWFIRYGRFKFGDEDFVKSKREMRNSLMFAVALVIVQVLVFAFLLKGRAVAR